MPASPRENQKGRGVTATVGNVHEPYLAFTHAPHLLLRALARGATWVEAIYFALPALSWQAVAIGDPLYRPFTPGRVSSTKATGEDSARLESYDSVRRMKRLETEGKATEALEAAVAEHRVRPGLVLGIAVAKRQIDRGDAAGAAASLALVRPPSNPAADEWALFREMAVLLQGAGKGEAALDWWRRLLSVPALGATLRLHWLPEAVRAARAEGASAQAEAWQTELFRLTPLAPPSR